MDRSAIREQMPSLVARHLPGNARRFKYNVFDGQPLESTMGFLVDPKPFTGTVVAVTDSALVIKTSRTQFAVLEKELASQPVDIGAKVEVTPYARRRFDGLRADTPAEETRYTADGQPYTVTVQILGKAPARLPVPKPRCPQLADLIEQIEEMPAPDGFRRISHMLVDANARDFACVDPRDADIIRTPPAVSFTATSNKFNGRVTILYDRAGDTYTMEFLQQGVEPERCDDVYFDDLGPILEERIDDGSWRKIRIEILSGKSARKLN